MLRTDDRAQLSHLHAHLVCRAPYLVAMANSFRMKSFSFSSMALARFSSMLFLYFSMTCSANASFTYVRTDKMQANKTVGFEQIYHTFILSCLVFFKMYLFFNANNINLLSEFLLNLDCAFNVKVSFLQVCYLIRHLMYVIISLL